MNECEARDCTKNIDGKCKKNKVDKTGKCVAYAHRVGFERRKPKDAEGTKQL